MVSAFVGNWEGERVQRSGLHILAAIQASQGTSAPRRWCKSLGPFYPLSKGPLDICQLSANNKHTFPLKAIVTSTRFPTETHDILFLRDQLSLRQNWRQKQMSRCYSQ